MPQYLHGDVKRWCNSLIGAVGDPDGPGRGADPAIFALTVALATSNSFLIPTHQVNALIMGPAGYGVRDFLKAGIGMTALFLIVMLLMLN